MIPEDDDPRIPPLDAVRDELESGRGLLEYRDCGSKRDYPVALDHKPTVESREHEGNMILYERDPAWSSEAWIKAANPYEVVE